MTSHTQTPTRYTRPEYQVSVQSVRSSDGSQLVKADYVECPKGMLPLMSRENASEVLGISLYYILSAMELPRGVEYSTWNSPDFASQRAAEVVAGKPLKTSHRTSSILTACRFVEQQTKLFGAWALAQRVEQRTVCTGLCAQDQVERWSNQASRIYGTWSPEHDPTGEQY
jgi:hypothetical protein